MNIEGRYILFAGDDYYPLGGARDLVGSFASVDMAVAAHNPNEFNYEGGWANVLDQETLLVVAIFDRGVWKRRPDGFSNLNYFDDTDEEVK